MYPTTRDNRPVSRNCWVSDYRGAVSTLNHCNYVKCLGSERLNQLALSCLPRTVSSHSGQEFFAEFSCQFGGILYWCAVPLIYEISLLVRCVIARHSERRCVNVIGRRMS